jgi:predicted AlkP superfamily phosphohydrolase/phosphomutase
MAVDGRTMRFGDLFYKMDTGKTGMHHPDGILWIRRPNYRHQTTAEKVPLTAVAPTLLNLLNVPAPSHMTTAPLPV